MAQSGDQGGDQKLSWGTVVIVAGVIVPLIGGSWAVFQTQFANMQLQITIDRQQNAEAIKELKADITAIRREYTDEKRFDEALRRLDGMSNRMLDLAGKAARNPVERDEVVALIGALDKRQEVTQAQIADINRQIAAAILIGPAEGDRKKALVPQ
jgi:hypothetical protein